MTNTTTLAASQTSTTTTTWNIDPSHSMAEFKVNGKQSGDWAGRFTCKELVQWQ